LLRDDERLDDLRAVARPPRAPAVRTLIVPRPLVREELRDEEAEDLRAVARPPLAPARFFCAVEPERPPFAPAAFTVIDPRPLDERDEVFARDDVFGREAVVFLRDEVFVRDEAVARFAPPDVLFFVLDEDADVVFLRDEVPPPREELELRAADPRDDDDEDFVSPD